VALLACLVAALVWALPAVTGAMQAPEEPVVAILSPPPDATLNDRVAIEGWAVDPTSTAGTGINPRDIQLWLGAPPDGKLLDYAQYGLASPQAMQFYGSNFQRSGFVRSWETCSFPPGPYDLWVIVSSLANPGAFGFNKVDLTVAPCAPGTELYRADFGTYRALSTASLETGRAGDGWFIRHKTPGATGEYVEGVFGNFRVEVTARLVGRALNRYYYLQFRQVPGPGDSLTDKYYRFSVDPDFASFDFALWDGRDEKILVEETRLETLIRPPAEENRLAVVADGPRMQLFINDVRVGEAVDSTYLWGRISFGMGTGQEANGEAHFRNFVISTP
jgi:hypothetical protein